MTRELPVLELRPDCLVRPMRADLGLIEAMMLYPHDAEQRSRVHLFLGVETAKSMYEKGSRDEWLIDGLVQFGPETIPLVELQKHAEAPFRRGVMAGVILRNSIYEIARNPTSARMAKIRHEVAKKFFGRRINGRNNNRGEQTIQTEIWPTYRCVSHFWAAYIDLAVSADDAAPFPCTVNQLGRFLSAAEAFLDAGSATRFKQAPSTVLKRQECVEVPALPNLPKSDICL